MMKQGLQIWTGLVIGVVLVAGCTATRTASKLPGRVGSTTRFSPSVQSNEHEKSESAGLLPSETTAPSQVQLVANHVQVEAAKNHALGEVAPLEKPSIASIGEQTDSKPREEGLGGPPLPINLPTALAMVGGQHPIVGFAQWRVREAYAQLDQAHAMWLPSIQTGFNYRRRDGIYQAVDGAIVDVNLNSMNYGLGAGAVAAGSPSRPGVVAQFHLADAIFLPKAAEKTAWARGHAANAIVNQQLLQGGTAYIDLLEAYQDAEIIAAAVSRTTDLAKVTEDFAEAGEGLQSDADRTATELSLLKTRQLAARERQLVASTRLARVLSIPMTSSIIPQDAVVVPVEMMPQATDEASLISMGLATRPELKESQALVAAACEAYKRERYAPFVPSVLLGFSSTSFGGGLGSNAENFGGRYDIDAMMVWEMRNLGLGEGAAKRTRNAQVQQATYAKLRILDQVAQEVAEANIQVGIRKQQVVMAQTAIERARNSYERNIDRIRDGQGLPIEGLQAIQALEASERAYLNAVANYNRSQLQLLWALGWSISMPPTATEVATVE